MRLTKDEVALTTLEQTQERVIAQLPRSLTSSHRAFLLSLVRAEPKWELMPFAHLQHLPALQWKLLNLQAQNARCRAIRDTGARTRGAIQGPLVIKLCRRLAV